MSERAIQKIFKSQYQSLIHSAQPLKNLKAIDAITHCRTKAMGSSYFRCVSNHKAIELHHSCRHRSCYLCAQKRRKEWVDMQRERLFPCAHFHVIFTLPHEYLDLWRYNEKFFSHLLFSASRDALLLVSDKRFHGVTPGIMTALHTWGRQMNLHPHVHCLITAGGLDANDQWKCIDKFLLPSRVLRSRYRGLIQDAIKCALQAGALKLPPSVSKSEVEAIWRLLWKKEWSIRIEERYAHGKGIMLYLSRYLKGGPMNPHQILRVESDSVSFRYLDHRDKRKKNLRLSLGEFTRRLLIHVPHVGIHTFRYYGLYAPAAKRRRLLTYRCLRGADYTAHSPRRKDVVLFCGTCGARARLTHSFWRSEATKAFSLYKGGASEKVPRCVQQVDEADHFGERFRDTS